MATVVKNIPIGITFPLRDGKVGYFEQSTDSFTAYRMNIINLLRTRQGERRMNPTFGCRLWTVVFEPNDEFIAKRVKTIINEDITQWIPGITITSVDVEYINNEQSVNLKDIYKLYIVVTFVINSINVSDTVELTLDVNKV
jgi:phage baseplate assembly protein W